MKKARWKTECGLQRKIDSYFKECEEHDKVATKISLAVYLGLTKDEFYRLASGEYDTEGAKFSHILHLADLRIEEYMERLLFTREKGHSAIMFYLKSNFGWSDKEAKEEIKDDSISVNISVIEEGDLND